MRVISAKAAAAGTANGPQIDQHSGAINPANTSATAIFQALSAAPRGRRYRICLIASGWVVVRRSDGLRKSIPVFRRRAVPIFAAEARR
jgi:hypothetical protein